MTTPDTRSEPDSGRLANPCPTCLANPGERCMNATSVAREMYRAIPHAARIQPTDDRTRFICTTDTPQADALALEAADLIESGHLLSHRDVIDVRNAR